MLQTYSPAIAPPNFCTILQCLAESSSYFVAKVVQAERRTK